QILRGRRPVFDEEQSVVRSHLKLSGVVRRERGALLVRNPIYRRAFDDRWVREHLPVNWLKRLQYAAIVLAAAIVIIAPTCAIYPLNEREKTPPAGAEAQRRGQEAEPNRQEAELKLQAAIAAQATAETTRDEAIAASEQSVVARDQAVAASA